MSVHRVGLNASGRRRLSALVAVTLTGSAALAGCSASATDSTDGGGSPAVTSGDQSPSTSPSEPVKTVSDARLTTNLSGRKNVAVDTLVKVSATDGTLKRVRVAAGKDRLPGAVGKSKASWTATQRLEPGTTYLVTGVAVDADGLKRTMTKRFRTQPLTLDQQTYPSIAPLADETVGVGMPVIVSFDVPVTDRAEIEKHLSVDTKPQQAGTWHWISDNEVHWRPRTYWKPGTDVTVNADINGVNAGNGIYGQEDRSTSFHIGDSVMMNIDLVSHEMRVVQNGSLLKTIPITGGKPGFTTRSGIKVIIEKFRSKRMDAATTGIDPSDPEYYNLSDVEYAQRVTYTGEFLHAAPWSVCDQGAANVSHGCVGMSTSDAAWLFGITKRGDVVDVTGTDRPMEPGNGYGDWNLSYRDYKAGSALH